MNGLTSLHSDLEHYLGRFAGLNGTTPGASAGAIASEFLAGERQPGELPAVAGAVATALRADIIPRLAAFLADGRDPAVAFPAAAPASAPASNTAVAASPHIAPAPAAAGTGLDLHGESRAAAIRAACGADMAPMAESLIRSDASVADAFTAIRVAREAAAAASRPARLTVAERAAGATEFGAFGGDAAPDAGLSSCAAGWKRAFAKASWTENHVAGSGGPGEMASAHVADRAGWSKAFSAADRAAALRITG